MQPNKNLIFLILVLFVGMLSFSQQANTSTIKTINENNIEEKFNYISKISSNYKADGKRYEVINLTYYETLRSDVIDTIKVLKNEISEAKKTIDSQEQKNTTLQSELNETKAKLDTTNSEKDKISLFGNQISKSLYNIILWSIIGVLIVLLLVYIYKFKNSNAITKAAKKSLEDTEIEFEEHRKIALEREQKVRRQLQDEINKHKSNNK